VGEEVFTMPLKVRYLEVDAQGVVFNSWYLAYFDDAMTAFLAARGLPYPTMLAAGYDVQLVRSEIDWRSGIGWQDAIEVAVSPARIGRTSFALDFEVRRDGTEVTCSARTVYVVVGNDGSGKREIPALIAGALGEARPLRNGPDSRIERGGNVEP
jgi:acyl-CoA thioester hydrolase